MFNILIFWQNKFEMKITKQETRVYLFYRLYGCSCARSWNFVPLDCISIERPGVVDHYDGLDHLTFEFH